jgi:hypothetical protein
MNEPDQSATNSVTSQPFAPGQLPPWEQAELPAPPPFSIRNAFRIIGPGAIMLAASIGGGEWLVGPATVIQHGPTVLWVATVAIVLQVIFNLEGIRYTLYTGEPILSGIMRLQPGCRFWGATYVALTALQLGIPALAPACATVVFSACVGRMPGVDASDANLVIYITYGIILFTLLILLFGGTIERMLEWASWFMVAYIFGFLMVVNIWFVPLKTWLSTASGFVAGGTWSTARDSLWLLLRDPLLMATFFATAGSGGIGNLTITNWIRDKGFGMGATVGAIPSAVGAKEIHLSHVGKVFAITAENLSRFRTWWRYVVLDQVWLWAGGCFFGMFLNVNLARAIMPQGSNISGVGAGAYQAQHMAEHFWSGLWILGLLNGFWILFSTQLGNTDVLIRTLTDTLWTASRRVRTWRDGSIAKVYYSLLIAFTLWGMLSVNFGTAMDLFKVLGTMAGVVLALAGAQIYFVNTRLLPPELQPTWWRKGALLLCSLAYGVMSAIAGYAVLSPLLKKWFG